MASIRMAKEFTASAFERFGLTALDMDREMIPFASLCGQASTEVGLYFDAELGRAVHLQPRSWRFVDVAEAYDDFANTLEAWGVAEYAKFVVPNSDGEQLGLVLSPSDGRAYMGTVAAIHLFFGIAVPAFDSGRPGIPWKELEAVIKGDLGTDYSRGELSAPH